MHRLRSTVYVSSTCGTMDGQECCSNCSPKPHTAVLPIIQKTVQIDGCVVVLHQTSRLTIVVTTNKGRYLLYASSTTGTNVGCKILSEYSRFLFNCSLNCSRSLSECLWHYCESACYFCHSVSDTCHSIILHPHWEDGVQNNLVWNSSQECIKIKLW